ncbi:DNA polymerase Y family protein [Pedobacter changchengzhani]|uniref:DNA polymerase Y family protein n=1 Tax=Pedobacter changchengzhani TaxID=2529274 RepID=A0A4V3A075_9SPHI|nr:DNA polymerase Y family protein [Pedobacter changchengzhani]TDG36513.1 DNA polymerase Y family protein [Pedobacter changchengzhani]
MKRMVSIWFPNLLSDWLATRKPELKGEVFVFTKPERGRIIVTASSKEAEKQGIFCGAILADAKAIVPNIQCFDDEANLNKKLLTRIAKWAIRYSPFVAIDLPEGIILDSSGCSHLWGGEEKYLQHILAKLNESGYGCRAALSDTIGTSWAIARFGKKLPIIAPNEQYNALLNLPPIALRLETNSYQRLYKLGLDKIGKFIQMPRSVLRRRFGEGMLLKLAQALGTEEETVKPIIIIQPYEERLACLEPIRTKTAIEIAIEKLLENLCNRLASDGLGMRSAELKGYRLDGKVTLTKIGTNQPSHNIKHLFKLFQLRIDQIEPALGIELFMLTAIKTEAMLVQQEKLWGGKPGLADQNIAQLLDRLAGKIGPQAIKRYIPQAHYWPERSLRTAVSLEEKSECSWQKVNPRPMEMLKNPEPVQVTAPIPDYPPMNFRYKDELHLIKKADGPERIEREWWIEKGEHRDYYIVEDEKGRRYWIFRSGHYSEEKSNWFIHGFFA